MVSFNYLLDGRNKIRGGVTPPVRFSGIKKNSTDVSRNQFMVWAEYKPRVSGPLVPRKYNTVIVFDKITYALEPSKSNPFPVEEPANFWQKLARFGMRVEVAKSHTVYMAKPDLDFHPVGVSCTCPDYFWTWWYYNRHKALAHQGSDLPYPGNLPGVPKKRKTDNQSYGSPPNFSTWQKPGKPYDPRRNKIGTPGICKHIVDLAERIEKMGWVKK